MTLQVGILGAGQAGARHITGFQALEQARIASVADADPERARREAARCGATPCQDWRNVIEGSPALDAVVVALPHHLHAEAACLAAAHGLHILLEKPMGTTMQEGCRIVEACEQAGVMLMMGYVHRFRTEAIQARAWIEAGHIGLPVNCTETIASPRGAHLGAWVNAPDHAGGGVLLYTGIHALDRLLWLVDAPLHRVHAAVRQFSAASQVEEAVATLLEFDNQAMAVFSVNGPTYPCGVTGWRSEIYGTEGVIRIQARQSAEIASTRLEQQMDVREVAAAHGEHYNFQRQAAAFVDAIQRDLHSPVSGRVGLAALEACQAIYDSAETFCGSPPA